MLIKKILISLVVSAAVAANASTAINSGSSFDVGFSPNQGSLQLVLKSIASAHKSIHVAAYSFTSKPIAEALLQAAKRGVDVEVIADEKSNSGKYFMPLRVLPCAD